MAMPFNGHCHGYGQPRPQPHINLHRHSSGYADTVANNPFHGGVVQQHVVRTEEMFEVVDGGFPRRTHHQQQQVLHYGHGGGGHCQEAREDGYTGGRYQGYDENVCDDGRGRYEGYEKNCEEGELGYSGAGRHGGSQQQQDYQVYETTTVEEVGTLTGGGYTQRKHGYLSAC